MAGKKLKHHVIHVEENIAGGKIHGFVSSKITADIVEKLLMRGVEESHTSLHT